MKNNALCIEPYAETPLTCLGNYINRRPKAKSAQRNAMEDESMGKAPEDVS